MVTENSRTHGTTHDDEVRREMEKSREIHAKNQKHDYSHVFRKKSRLELIRLSCVIIGIEFAYAAETAFVSPTLLEIGIEHKHMTMVWSLSPFLGFVLAPIMGSLSDRCSLKWGRRRPLILILSIVLLAGLVLVAWGKDFGTLVGDETIELTPLHTVNLIDASNFTHFMKYAVKSESLEGVQFYKWAAVFTIIGTVFLDFSADSCQTPARTFLLDLCVPDDHTKALSIFTVLAGTGGFLGYALGGINWEETSIGDFLGGNVKTVFAVVILLYIVSCIITMTSFREIPLSLMEHDELLKPICQNDIKKEQDKISNPIFIIKQSPIVDLKEFPSINNYSLAEVEKQPPSKIDNIENQVTLKQYLKSIVIMPNSMKILCFTNLLAWMAHVSYCLYFTDFVGETVFLGDPTASPGSEKYINYQSGVRFGCWGMSVYSLSCAIYSMAIEALIKRFGAKIVYISGLLSFGIGMMILAIYPTKVGVIILSSTAGVIYATNFTIPYLLVATYHASGSFKMRKGQNVPLKQTRGFGTDIAIAASMMFVAQIIVSLSIGPLITLIGSTSAVIYAAGVFGISSAVAALRVLYMNL